MPRTTLALALLVLALPSSLAAQARRLVTELEGTLEVAVVDYAPSLGRAPEHAVLLRTDDFRRHPLELTEAQLRDAGGARAIAGRRARVRLADGVPDASAKAPKGITGGAPVAALQLIGLPAGTMQAARLPVAATEPFLALLCGPGRLDLAALPTQETMAARLGDRYPGLDAYWREVSGGRVTLTGTQVVGWVTPARDSAHYFGPGWETRFGGSIARDLALMRDCAEQAQSRYGDLGRFRGIALQLPVWAPTSYAFYDPITHQIGGRTIDLRTTVLANWAMPEPGVWAHELGHTFGLGHSRVRGGGTYASRWDVMSTAAWVAVNDGGTTLRHGTHTLGAHKDELGWIAPERKWTAPANGSASFLLAPAAGVATSGYQLAYIPFEDGSGHRYALETRRRGAAGTFDVLLPGEGVIVTWAGPVGSYWDGWAQVLDLDGDATPVDVGAPLGVGGRFEDPAQRTWVRVDSLTAQGYWVTVSRAAAPTVTLAVSQSRHHPLALPNDTTALWDGVNLTIQGAPDPGAVPWQVTKRRPYTTLAVTSGRGNARIEWRRSAVGLPVGIHVDTITISTTSGEPASVRVVDTLEVVPEIPLGGSLSGLASGGRTRYYGIRVTSPPPDATLMVTMSGGSGPQPLLNLAHENRPEENAGCTGVTQCIAPVRAGRWFAMLQPSSQGAFTGVTLSAAYATRTTLAVTPTGRRLFHVGAGTPPGDSVMVIVTGPAASQHDWTTRLTGYRHLQPQQDKGVGTRPLHFTRRVTGLTPGVSIDTIRVSGTGLIEGSGLYVDTLVYRLALTASLARPSRRDTITAGTERPDSVVLALSRSGVRWTASARSARTVLQATEGFNTGPVRWRRDARTLQAGLSVDTIEVVLRDSLALAGEPALATLRYVDSLEVLAAGPTGLRVTLATSATARRALVQMGAPAPDDSVRVEIGGEDADRAAWSATTDAAWLRLTASRGGAGGWLRWARDASDRLPGTLAARIEVRIEGTVNGTLTGAVVDTLVITDRPQLALGATTRRDTAVSGAGDARRDSTRIELSSSTPTAWSATAKARWIRLDAGSGTVQAGAPAMLRWSRLSADLRPGSYVDTLVVRTPDGLEARLVDSLLVRAPTAVTAERAIAGLRGSAQLTPAEARYLDLAGNADGVLNLGDVLAQLEREGQMPSAALLEELGPIERRIDGPAPVRDVAPASPPHRRPPP